MLLGATNPSGKLPITFLRRESDGLRPCTAQRCPYGEKLLYGWRGLQSRPVAWAFGHGLSYTTFAYRWSATPPDVVQCTVATGGDASCGSALSLSVVVSNVGTVTGAEVAQLYVHFPAALDEPNLVLRAFAKTKVLAPGGEATVQLNLTPRDLSTWDTAEGGGWRLAAGSIQLSVGTSSRDLSLQHAFELRVAHA